MPRFLRAFFRSEDDDTSNLILDVLLGDDRKIVQRVPLFGFWGKLNSSELWPFVYHGGEVDFGDQADPNSPEDKPLPRYERFADFDIADRIIAQRESFTLTYMGEKWRMVLEKMTDIADL